MAVTDDPNLLLLDEETEEDKRRAELSFEITSGYSPCPLMPRIKTVRTAQLESTCCFSDSEQKIQNNTRPEAELESSENSEEVTLNITVPAPDTSLPNLESKEKQQMAIKIANIIKNPSVVKSKAKTQHQATIGKQAIIKSSTTGGTLNFAQEYQAIKRQKIEEGKSRKILDVKPQHLPHKTRLGEVATGSSSNLFSSATKTQNEERKMYVRQQPVFAPFVSTAEMMKKFQSSTREISFPHAGTAQTKPGLTLTRPKEPEFETSQRVRPTKVKNSADLEEEMMAKIPKFKARPVNKKILEAPTQPPLPKSTPQCPEFKEFHLQTMARGMSKNVGTTSVQTTESSTQSWQVLHHLTVPKLPALKTSLRARPPTVKSTEEMEKEELEKAPKFKTRPLNRKLLLNSKSQNVKTIPRKTVPDPFHLYTEERGVEKERKLLTELLQKQIDEEKSRYPKAILYPYTTDYPVMPPKPEPKPCTKPQPFELESLTRHEQELQKEMEERRRMEMEEAKMRLFKAQPILTEDPIPVAEKERKPLTEVQEFNLHVDHRAVERVEFDNKIKEKEMAYKRYREEAENARMMEEEKALKQLRRTLVPHARPVPSDHPFLPQKSSKQVTKPSSPKLLVLS